MNGFMAGLLLGTGVGIGMLLCPQVRGFVDKIENKVTRKKQKEREKAEE